MLSVCRCLALRIVRPILFFFNDTATTEIYTLSLHDALPIWPCPLRRLPHAAQRARGGDARPLRRRRGRRLDRLRAQRGLARARAVGRRGAVVLFAQRLAPLPRRRARPHERRDR